ncbi:sigma-70 family RNA polymerase sigma factor [Glycocaulis profundi]|nr:sigma-70 family RNA polymerase sigma factor [Glycocaulis profundi]
MEQPSEIQSEILGLIPSLRAFAYSLARNRCDADDLVQETLAKALANLHRFEPGTNLRAWLFTILRNSFYNAHHKRQREPAMPVEDMPMTRSKPGQEWSLKLKDVHAALGKLPAQQREALMLVGGAGFSYIEAAEVLGCAIGTIKSRVNRARANLLTLLDSESELDFLEEKAG